MLSSIIGSVSAGMTALRSMSSDETKRMWMLRRYLKQQNASRGLSQRIVNFCEYHSTRQYNLLTPGKVTLLASLSDQLKFELATEINSPLLTRHHLFAHLSDRIPSMMARICKFALQPAECGPEDVIFHPGEMARFMYFVRW